MKRDEIEKVVDPIIRKSLRELEYTPEDVPDADFAVQTDGMFRPDVRRVSLILSMAQASLGADASGEGLEVGSAFGYLLFSAAVLLPRIRWTGVDHPGRTYRHRDAYEKAFQEYNCGFTAVDICKEPLPFSDGQFAVVTFSEVLEHLPMERVHFVLSEIARVVRPNGILIVSSPNQASLENRVRLLKGKSILDLPTEADSANGMFGHIRLYTPSEVVSKLAMLGFRLERSEIETNISGYRASAKSLRRRMYALYERLEERIGMLRGLGDTYYLAFRKERLKV
jgi:2-polyprenyl-3-methyl-5-hydroxy-6-metoxy-1,4-benzoquinol methylase